MQKQKNGGLYYPRRTGAGRPMAGVLLILIGVFFLLIYAGVFNPSMIGEFFGRFGSSMGEFFGNFGRSIGELFGNLGEMIGRLWPVLLIAAGLALLFIRRKPSIQ